MRRWKPTIQSIFGLLGRPAPSTTEFEDAAEEIREAMLAALGPAALPQHDHLARRIRFAVDLPGLWFLRGDLMRAVASLHSEAHARDVLRELSKRFEGFLPAGLATRPSPLGD